MFRRVAAFIGLALLAGVWCAHAQDAGKDETIKIRTTLVSVPVIVSDRNGRYVPNLTAADFTITQDGASQAIDFFAATEEPITVALLIDTSQSTRPVLGNIKSAARSFVKQLLPNDRAMVVCFDYDTHILSGLTSNQDQLDDAVKSAEIPRDFGTTLRDAVYQTLNSSFHGVKGRKAIILLTDGKDVGSRVRTDELLYSLQESDTMIYTIYFKTEDGMGRGPMQFPRGSGRGGGFPGSMGRFPGGGVGFPGGGMRRDRMERVNQAAEEFLRNLSDVTAGRFYSSKKNNFKNTFALIADELRYQYRLGFYPPESTAASTLHEIKVKVTRPDTVVRARSSYRAQAK